MKMQNKTYTHPTQPHLKEAIEINILKILES